MRIYELAKKLGVTSKELLQILENNGIQVKNHMSSVDAGQVKLLTQTVKKEGKKKTAPRKTTTKKTAAKKTATKKSVPKKTAAKKTKAAKTVAVKEETVKPVKETAKPVKETAKPVKETAKPVKETAKPKSVAGIKEKPGPDVKPVIKPVSRGAEPVAKTPEPAGKKTAPVRERPRPASVIKGKVKEFPRPKHAPVQKFKPKVVKEPVLPESITIMEVITVRELAQRLNIPVPILIQKLMGHGYFLSVNQLVEEKICREIAESMGVLVLSRDDIAAAEEKKDAGATGTRPRGPVVTLLGHVDHGKTSLLDCIRKSHVVKKEAGGITQHIGAYRVVLPNNNVIVFLDTPGHEAFTAMRARGAKVTDIVILVVAADDGVMPQTIEAINHAKAANVPIIVAVNKIDKAGANPDNVAKDLMKYQLIPEKWGGDTIVVHVSAKENTNIDELIEMIVLQSEMMELKANPDQPAIGRILETKLDKARGAVATVLVQNGTLKVGDAFICGLYSGKVRALIDDQGSMVKEAGPSTPVSVLGISGMPSPGDLFKVVTAEKKARQLAEQRKVDHSEKMQPVGPKVSLKDLFEQIQKDQVKEFNIVLKTDVQGSIEAITQALEQVKVEGVNLVFIHTGVGLINTSDVLLAAASNAVIFGFGTRVDTSAKKLAETESVEIRLYSVIYDVITDVQKALTGLLDPEKVEEFLGRAEVVTMFKVPKVGIIAGCRVKDGKILRNSEAKVLRENQEIYAGKVTSLKRFKDDVREVASGYDCGIGISGFTEFEEGDVIESFAVKYVQPEVGDN